MPIDSLIELPNRFVQVRDRIVEILALETQLQQARAIELDLDPKPYRLRVFAERSSPWGEWTSLDEIDDETDRAPIVNVAFQSSNPVEGSSSVVSRQTCEVTYRIECFGLGVSTGTATGRLHADEMAAAEAQRAASLVHSILMAGTYAYLGFPRGAGQIVGKRWVQSITQYEPRQDERQIFRIGGLSILLNVRLDETHPQVIGTVCEGVDVSLRRGETGEIYAEMSFGDSL